MKRTLFGFTAAALLAGSASGTVVVSEIHGNTTSTDAEYIELYNDGTAGGSIDISGWVFDIWDSDTTDGDFGTQDFTITIPSVTVLAVGETYVLASPQAESVFSITADLAIANNSIENDSSTYVLSDSSANIIETLFSVDPGEGPAQANINGVSITPDVTFGPDGSFFAAGYYRTTAAGDFILTDFGNGAPSSPGDANYAAVPEPTSLALLSLGGLCMLRRRR